MPSRLRTNSPDSVLIACLLAACSSIDNSPASRPSTSTGELSFAVISDTQIEPASTPHRPEPLEWLSRALHERQSLPSLGMDAPAPEFLLICGNLTKSGAVQDGWSHAERLFDSLSLPWFAAAGPLDMSVAPVFEGFQKRFGGLVYSFDRSGAHFVALCSATPCETRPCFSPLQLNWLREDLARNADRQPVFVILHHAPDSDELAPSQVLELRAAFDGHDIAAIFSAGTGRPELRQVAGLDCVRCGSASTASLAASPDERGYAEVSIAGGKLRVAHRYFDPSKQPLLLLEKTLRYRVQAPFSIEAPLAGAPARDKELDIAVRGPNAPLTFLLDGEPRTLDWRRDGDGWRASLPVQGLAGGAHQIAVSCDYAGTPRLATRLFLAASPEVAVLWRRSFEGSLRAAPVLTGERLAIASTAGEIAVLDAKSGALIWSARTAGVLGSPWCGEDGTVVVSNTAGWVEAYDRAGGRSWRFQLGKPGLAGVSGDGELVFATDESGMVHALELASGQRRWHRKANESDSAAPATAPREAGGRAVWVSETGAVTLLDAARGEAQWTWRATAGGFLTATPLVGSDGTVWIAGLDGWLSAVRAR